jgi:sulfite exporter TauE/SafE
VYLIAAWAGLGKLSLFSTNNYGNLGVVFLIGLTAGLSSCMALVGGLVLGTASRFAEKHPAATAAEKFRPHLFFNTGRILSYFILGGLIGLIGSTLKFSPFTLGGLTMIAGVVMLFLGLQLIEIFPKISRFSLTMPKSISRLLHIKSRAEKEYSHTNSMILGALTFFLPCGFTQAMQIYAISSNSPVIGALTMGIFALGTTPGLLGIGGLTSLLKGNIGKKFFKFIGVVVIALALLNINSGFNLTGLNFSLPSVSQPAPDIQLPQVTDGTQIVYMDQASNGYSPNRFTVKKGVPVKWVINSKDDYSCASNIVMPQYNISKLLDRGENVITFTPTETGTIRFTCSMGMYTGNFEVI